MNLKSWREEFRDIKKGSKNLSWSNKYPRAYWKGNPDVDSPTRTELLKCNHSRMWGAQIMRQVQTGTLKFFLSLHFCIIHKRFIVELGKPICLMTGLGTRSKSWFWAIQAIQPMQPPVRCFFPMQIHIEAKKLETLIESN